MRKIYQVIRNDGAQIPRIDFESRAEAEQCLKEMAPPLVMPFTSYQVREVRVPDSESPIAALYRWWVRLFFWPNVKTVIFTSYYENFNHKRPDGSGIWAFCPQRLYIQWFWHPENDCNATRCREFTVLFSGTYRAARKQAVEYFSKRGVDCVDLCVLNPRPPSTIQNENYLLVTKHIDANGSRFGRRDFGWVETREEAQAWVNTNAASFPPPLKMEVVAYGSNYSEVRPDTGR